LVLSQHPNFVPVLYKVRDNYFSVDSRKIEFLSIDQIDTIRAFASILLTKKDPICVPTSLYMIEKAFFSAAYHNLNDEYTDLFGEAHNFYKKQSVYKRLTKTWYSVHWSKPVVPKQMHNCYGYGLYFWELPKLVVSKAMQQHVKGSIIPLKDRIKLANYINDFGKRHRSCLKFLTQTRPEYKLHGTELMDWSEYARSYTKTPV